VGERGQHQDCALLTPSCCAVTCSWGRGERRSIVARQGSRAKAPQESGRKFWGVGDRQRPTNQVENLGLQLQLLRSLKQSRSRVALHLGGPLVAGSGTHGRVKMEVDRAVWKQEIAPTHLLGGTSVDGAGRPWGPTKTRTGGGNVRGQGLGF
jgi:hypothetical protein